MTTNKPIPLEHQHVPQEHQGLHGFLYSSEDEHGAVDAAIAHPSATADITPLDAWCEAIGNAKIAGVYAVLNGDRHTQYIGYSRNVALALRGHVTQIGADICAFVRVQPFKFPKRDEMESLQNAWIAELGVTPPGNVDESGLWANTIGAAAIAAMSAAERQAYEEKKLKLRKAMAEAESRDGDGEGGDSASADLSVRRHNLEAAVTEDDWSSVVQQQTQETL